MDEKVIIKSEQYNFNKFRKRVIIFSICIILFGVLLYIFNIGGSRIELHDNGHQVTISIFQCMAYAPFFWEFLLGYGLSGVVGLFIDVGLILLILLAIVSWWLSSYSITITDKRIFGKTSFGKRVDLPVDSISAVATSTLKGIAVATSSGKIVFKLIKNRDELHKAISDLIISRQNKSANKPVEIINVSRDVTDELKKYKELLDTEVITQEEFDAKKKQLLEV